MDVLNDTNESINVTTTYDLKNAKETTGVKYNDVNNKVGEAKEDKIYDDDLDKYEQELQKPIQVNQSFQFRTMLSLKDQEIPVIITVYPNRKTGSVEVDEKLARKLARKLKGF